MRRLAWLALCALLAAGCPPAPPPKTAEQLCAELCGPRGVRALSAWGSCECAPAVAQ